MTGEDDRARFNIGDMVLMDWKGATVQVNIKDRRVVYGRDEYLVTDLSGRERWVNGKRLSTLTA